MSNMYFAYRIVVEVVKTRLITSDTVSSTNTDSKEASMGLLFICSLTENNIFALEIEVNHTLK